MNPADVYETYFVPGMFRPLSRALLPLAAAKSGDRLLDLACGTGIIARQVAPVVGAEGRVVALDLRQAMLDVASKLTVPYGAAIEWVQGDATKLDFAKGSFDIVACQQGLQFFPDRAAALAEVKRVLRPGGRLVFLEHVASDDPAVFRKQRFFEPAWRLLAGGCHVTRRTDQAIERAGLSLETVTRDMVRKAMPIVRPSVRGVARKR